MGEKRTDRPKVTDETKSTTSRRKFLKMAVATAAGAATLGFPMVSRARPVVLKMQGAWGAKDIFNEYAVDYVKRVNEMSGGSLRIDYLVSGAAVKAFRIQDAVHKGVLDAGHQVTAYWYGKSKVAVLFGPGPVFGQNAHHTLGWIYYGGGQELYDELIERLGINTVGFFCMPMPTQPLGWFRKPIKNARELRGLRYRTAGLAADLFQEMGVKVTQLPGGEIVSALERGVIEAFEFNNPSSDKSFGAHDVSKVYMMGSYHQAAEFFEIIFNKDKYKKLAKEHQAILKYSAEAANSDNFWKGIDRYSKDLLWLRDKAGVKLYRTPQSIMTEQLKAWDVLIRRLEKAEPFFGKVVASQKAYAHRVAYYDLINQADYFVAFMHYFGNQFPWPAPKPYAFRKIPSHFLTRGNAKPNLKQIANRLEAVLRSAGYSELSYHALDDGFAIVTRIEQTYEDGRSLPLPYRWNITSAPPIPFSLELAGGILKAHRGYYRIVIFAVTRPRRLRTGQRISTKEAMDWYSSGFVSLPDEIGNWEFTTKHTSLALIYEFFRKTPDHDIEVNEPRLPGEDHLRKANIWKSLEV